MAEEPEPPRTNPYAIAALVSAFLCLPVGLALGIVALVQIRRRPQPGTGLAIAGLAISTVLLGLVVVGIAIRHASGGSDDVLPTYDATQGAAPTLQLGDCVKSVEDFKEAGGFHRVPCSEPHLGQVFAIELLPDGRWPGAAEAEKQATEICESEFDRREPTMRLPADTQIWIYNQYPNAFSWAQRDRTVRCFVSTPTAISQSLLSPESTTTVTP